MICKGCGQECETQIIGCVGKWVCEHCALVDDEEENEWDNPYWCNIEYCNDEYTDEDRPY